MRRAGRERSREEEGEREVVRRMGRKEGERRKGEKGSEEDDYFNKLCSVVLKEMTKM